MRFDVRKPAFGRKPGKDAPPGAAQLVKIEARRHAMLKRAADALPLLPAEGEAVHFLFAR